MSLRTDRTWGLRFAITRPKVIIPFFLALGFSSVESLWWLAMGFACLAVFRAYEILSYDDLVDQLRLRKQRQQCGIAGRLSPQERVEVLRIDKYARALKDSGAHEKLAEDILERMWILVKHKGPNGAAGELLKLRVALPALPTPYNSVPEHINRNQGMNEQDLISRIQQEFDLMRAARLEVEAG